MKKEMKEGSHLYEGRDDSAKPYDNSRYLDKNGNWIGEFTVASTQDSPSVWDEERKAWMPAYNMTYFTPFSNERVYPRNEYYYNGTNHIPAHVDARGVPIKLSMSSQEFQNDYIPWLRNYDTWYTPGGAGSVSKGQKAAFPYVAGVLAGSFLPTVITEAPALAKGIFDMMRGGGKTLVEVGKNIASPAGREAAKDAFVRTTQGMVADGVMKATTGKSISEGVGDAFENITGWNFNNNWLGRTFTGFFNPGYYFYGYNTVTDFRVPVRNPLEPTPTGQTITPSKQSDVFAPGTPAAEWAKCNYFETLGESTTKPAKASEPFKFGENVNLINLTDRADFTKKAIRYKSRMANGSSSETKDSVLFGRIKGWINEKRVNTAKIKEELKNELDTEEYLQRLKNAGYSEEQQMKIVSDYKQAIDNTKIVFDSTIPPRLSSYGNGVAKIGTKGASKDEIVEAILHEVGHSDTVEGLEGLSLLRSHNKRIVPAFRKEYLLDNPTDGRVPKWEYYSNTVKLQEEPKQ